MFQKQLVPLGITGCVCAVALFAADAWKSKEYTQWTEDEINKVLTDSAWAKQKTITPLQSGMGQRRGAGNGGGMGRRGGGIGFPGGGGYPGGGGGPIGGGGYPGGGGGYPGGGGGGGPIGGGGYPGEGAQRGEPMNVTVRWESALPVQQALSRQSGAGSEESKAFAESAQKYYVISVFGFRMGSRRGRQTDNDSDSDQDRSARSSAQSKDDLRSQFLDAAQLVPKSGKPIYADDVQVEGFGSGEIRYLFPRTAPIDASAKEVDFVLEVRGIKLEHKFHLADMQYQGKLAL